MYALAKRPSPLTVDDQYLLQPRQGSVIQKFPYHLLAFVHHHPSDINFPARRRRLAEKYRRAVLPRSHVFRQRVPYAHKSAGIAL